MKSTLYSLMALVALAFLGSFLTIWRLPYQEEPFTYHDFSRKLSKMVSLEDDLNLRKVRHEKLRENEELFVTQR